LPLLEWAIQEIVSLACKTKTVMVARAWQYFHCWWEKRMYYYDSVQGQVVKHSLQTCKGWWHLLPLWPSMVAITVRGVFEHVVWESR
jgi:hypothetical protein